MNIAYIVPSLAKQGPVIVVYELVNQLISKGHNLVVFYFDEKDSNLLNFKCETKHIKFKEKFDFNSFDIIHSHGFRPDTYVWFHRRNNDKPKFISTIHCFVFEDFKLSHNLLTAIIYTPIWMFFLKKIDLKVVLSKLAAKYYEKWFKKEDIVVVYNSRTIDSEKKLSDKEIDEILEFKGNDILLGTNAVLTPRKSIETVIIALQYLKNTKLFIVGDGKSKQDLEKLVSELHLSDRVYFAGYREDAFRFIAYYDVYVLPSKSEGFPLALLEAAALKCNAVISDIPIFKEFFSEDEVTFFELSNPQNCAKAIISAQKNNKKELLFQKYINEYSPERFAENYLSVYLK